MSNSSLTNHQPIYRGVIVIPARLESSRLPRKLLLDQTGKPLLVHAIENCKQAVVLASHWFSEVIVACDHEILRDIAVSCGVRAVMTSQAHPNGTSRIAEVIRNESLETTLDFVVNVQADQPVFPPAHLYDVAKLLMHDRSNDLATLAAPMHSDAEGMRQNTNIVKVAIDTQSLATCFSRSPISLGSSDGESFTPTPWFRHVGIYAYRIESLLEIAQLPPSAAEIREGLEQLRALDAGMSIRVLLIPAEDYLPGIDTLDDYRRFVEHWHAQCRIS